MKTRFNSKKWLLVLLAPLFINGVCTKNDDIATPVPLPTADQYVTWRFTNNNGSLSNPPDTLYSERVSNTTQVYGRNANYGSTCLIHFDGQATTGTYPAKYFDIYTNGRYYVQGTSPVQITVTNYGNVGQYLTGTYSGALKDSATSVLTSVSGEFKIKRR
jgi:hypothetical protein